MKPTTPEQQEAWKARFKGADIRPVQRATISRFHAKATSYDLADLPGTFLSGEKTGQGVLRSIYFGQDDRPVELPAVEQITWDRSDESDAATCTIVMLNSSPLAAGEEPTGAEADLVDRPGYYTFNRGTTAEGANRWGHTENGWRDMLRPDRLIRTFEGYGTDGADVAPENDTQLSPSGVWFIDDVDYSDGRITITCRDAGRWLIDLITVPPVVPWSQYPITWASYEEIEKPDIISKSLASKWFRPAYRTDSNIPYVGLGFTDGGMPYVDSQGGVLGHRGRHAFDSGSGTYWLSVGNYPNWSSAYEYVEGSFSSRPVSAVRVHTWGGPYRCYVSIMAGGEWQGRRRIPYRARAVDTNADIRFVAVAKVKKNGVTEIKLPKGITGATRVRLTFTDLMDTGIGRFQYRAGVRDVQVLGSVSVSTSRDGGTELHGNYGDYTDIVKWACAWGGLHWPLGATRRLSDNSVVSEGPSSTDSDVLPTGRAWGDFENTGTAGVADFDGRTFDKRPLMDMISEIRDIIGFTFWIDEVGGAIWRSPNVFQLGNYVWQEGGPNGGRTSEMIVIDDRETLLQMKAKLSSRTVRDWVFIANASGKYGAVSAGYNPVDTGMPRVGGWTDQNFGSDDECQIMGDLITMRQLFEYQTSTLTIPGNPSIQVDDQVLIYDEESGWVDVARVRGIKSTYDKRAGRWTYDLTVHWLGESPTQRWLTNSFQVSEVTAAFLRSIGKPIEVRGLVTGTPPGTDTGTGTIIVVEPEPDTSPDPDPEGVLLTWAPPAGYTSWATIEPNPGTRKINLDNNTDYWIISPDEPFDGAVVVTGGRNIVWFGPELGGRTSVPSGSYDSTHVGLRFKDGYNGPRIIHLEGVRGHSGTYLSDGIQFAIRKTSGLEVRLQNILLESTLYGSKATVHSDAVQIWGGVNTMRIDGFTAKICTYQGMYWDSADKRALPTGPRQPWLVRRTNLVGTPSSKYPFANRQPSYTAIVNDRVYHNGFSQDPTDGFGEWPSAGLTHGNPPGGDFVTPSLWTPSGYVSPGYVT